MKIELLLDKKLDKDFIASINTNKSVQCQQRKIANFKGHLLNIIITKLTMKLSQAQ